MTLARLHLIKLSVGSESVETLADWQARRLQQEGRLWHATRMTPRRREELLDPAAPGSIYWVIGGLIQARQQLLGIESDLDREGRKRCLLLLDPKLVRVEPQPMRPFQGWRYLAPEKAPADLKSRGGGLAEGGPEEGMPPKLLADLRSLGIL